MKQKSNEMKANQFKCVIRKQGVNGAKSETKKKKKKNSFIECFNL